MKPALLALLVASSRAFAQPTEPPSEAAKKGAEAQEREDREREEEEDREAGLISGTKTPIRPGPFVRPMPGEYIFSPALAGRTVYNCFCWAFCRRDSWTQPNGLITMAGLLAREGFGLAPVDCETSPAAHVVMIIWNVPDSALPIPGAAIPSDSWIIHGMKRLDGVWSSKNGQNGHHTGITDKKAFLDKWYPVPPGHTRVIRCFAK